VDRSDHNAVYGLLVTLLHECNSAFSYKKCVSSFLKKTPMGGGAGGRPGAGLQFPVGRIHRLLRSASRDLFPNSLLGRKGNYTGAPVYMAVVME
jgi:hypothetical protein